MTPELKSALQALAFHAITGPEKESAFTRHDAKALIDYFASRSSAIVEEPMAVTSERPIMQPPRISNEPEWAQVNALFRVHGLGDPPWRLRDELVGWLVWARYGASPQPHTGRAGVTEGPKVVGYGRDNGKLVRVEVLDGDQRIDLFRPSASPAATTLHETAVGELRILKRTLEMQSNIMRDPARTGGWAGAERVANAFASAAGRLATIILTQEPALNAALTVEPEAPWQSMETAPKDGTRIILDWDGKARVGYYLDNSKTSRPWQGWKVPSMEEWPSRAPERWMPFPSIRSALAP